MSSTIPSEQANLEMYDDYYDKPSWWFRIRYDTQFKRKTCLALAKRITQRWHRKTILELGFGSGDVLFSFPTDNRLIGVELSSSAVELARKKAAKRGYPEPLFSLPPDSSGLPAEDESVDLVFASHVLEHVANDRAVLDEIARVLKPEGHLVVLVPVNERFEDPKHVRPYTFDRCRQQCEAAGFDFVFGMENEYLYYLVEKLYHGRIDKPWGPGTNALRLAFNLATCWWPFPCYASAEGLIKRLTGLPPKQAALLLRKHAP